MARKADALVRRPRQRETGGPVFLTMDQKRLSESFHFFIYPHQAARAHNIRRRNGRESPLYLLAAQDAPRSSGKLNAHIADLWADVRLTLWSPWVKMRNVRCEQMFFALLPNSDPARSRWHVANVPRRPRTSVCGRGRYRPYSTLTLAARITLPHFSVSSAMSLPKSAGEP